MRSLGRDNTGGHCDPKETVPFSLTRRLGQSPYWVILVAMAFAVGGARPATAVEVEMEERLQVSWADRQGFGPWRESADSEQRWQRSHPEHLLLDDDCDGPSFPIGWSSKIHAGENRPVDERFRIRKKVAQAGCLQSRRSALSITPLTSSAGRIFTMLTTKGPIDIVPRHHRITPQWTKVEGISTCGTCGSATSSSCARRPR